ncbi:unnamed protein product [Rotaria sp. Silwood1]|nr:unnamed protein product [Rotaria sp. Silwood1]
MSTIPANARWTQNGVTVAGGHEKGDDTNQLYRPWSIFVESDQTLVIADTINNRIVQWKIGDTNGQVVAGGNGLGNRLNQFKLPSDVLIDKKTESLIICDKGNRRVLRWSQYSGTAQGEILIDDIDGWGLAMDEQRYLYISDTVKHDVKRYRIDDKNGTVVAGGHEKGDGLNQLNMPTYVFVDRQQAVYVSDSENHRVMKWEKDAKEGVVIAGGQGEGKAFTQLSSPRGLFVDTWGTLYVAEWGNHRVMCWPKAAKQGMCTIPANARWTQNGVTVAGGHEKGDDTNQLYRPWSIFVESDQILVIADTINNRIVQWKMGDTNGQVVAGGNGQGNRLNQFKLPSDVLIDKKTESLIICDKGNRRVLRWSRYSGTAQGEILVDDIDGWGLAMDEQRYLYISDTVKHEVKRYRIDDKNGTVVAGGHDKGDGLNQLNMPTYVFVDRQQAVYVSDSENHRVMKWDKDAKEGVVVAGGQGEGKAFTQLSSPRGLFVDTWGTLYVAEWGNHRVMCWPKAAKQGIVIVGRNGEGKEPNQVNRPAGLSFDQHGNIYVVDWGNDRVQRFSIE